MGCAACADEACLAVIGKCCPALSTLAVGAWRLLVLRAVRLSVLERRGTRGHVATWVCHRRRALGAHHLPTLLPSIYIFVGCACVAGQDTRDPGCVVHAISCVSQSVLGYFRSDDMMCTWSGPTERTSEAWARPAPCTGRATILMRRRHCTLLTRHWTEAVWTLVTAC